MTTTRDGPRDFSDCLCVCVCLSLVSLGSDTWGGVLQPAAGDGLEAVLPQNRPWPFLPCCTMHLQSRESNARAHSASAIARVLLRRCWRTPCAVVCRGVLYLPGCGLDLRESAVRRARRMVALPPSRQPRTRPAGRYACWSGRREGHCRFGASTLPH